jgi:hypothetical protein
LDRSGLQERLAMGRVRYWTHLHPRDQFGEGDHQEYVETGTRDIIIVAGAAVLLIGSFIISLL